MIGVRELIGWIITVLGLLLIAVLVYLALNRYVFEAMALSLPAVIVFRAGIGLVRLASAGRMARQLPGSASSDNSRS